MESIKEPVTGKEDQGGLSSPYQALVRFYSAFNNADLAAMERNWANTDDISMDNPLGGIKRGWKEIRGVYERIFNGPAEVYVEFYDYTIHETPQMFHAVGRERGYLRIGGTEVNLAIRTSRIFQKIDGRWRQVHHHGSIDDPELLRKYQSAVAGKRAGQRFDHVGLNVADLDRSIAFYQNMFGFRIIERWENPKQAFVGEDNTVLGLMEMPDYDYRAYTMAHLAFPCRREDFSGIVAKVRTLGLEIVSGPKPQRGGETILFRDPSGNILEVCHPPLAAV